jgi:hypothetical protein
MLTILGCGTHSGSSFLGATDAANPSGDAEPAGDAGPLEGSVTLEEAGPVFASQDGASMMCQPGTYVGSYTGTFQTAIPITGPVMLSLVPDTQGRGEIALVTNGASVDFSWGLMAGDASAPIVVTHAVLMGQLDCTNGTFDAAAPNAMFTIATVPSGMSMVDFAGTYDAQAQTISGTFTTMATLGNSMGTWEVTRMP